MTDLQSRNGTYVGVRRLKAGSPALLDQGAALGFGSPAGYVLRDASAPRGHAVRLDAPDDVREVFGGLLVLPSPEHPEATLYARETTWWLEAAGCSAKVTDGHVVATSAGLWRLYLPDDIPSTRKRGSEAPALEDLTLQFSVAAGDLHIELIARSNDQILDLKARAHHLPLLLLARVRLAEQQLPEAQQGWVHQQDLLERLGWEVGRLNLDVHRIRRQLADAGVTGAGVIIERRSGTGQLRIGTSRIEITPLRANIEQPPAPPRR